MRQIVTLVLATVALATLVTVGSTRAEDKKDEKAKKTIKEVMKTQKPLRDKILKGTATKEDKEKMLALYQAMAENKPPKGDAESWKKFCDALISATKDVVDDKDKAVDAFKQASNCTDCHKAHKGKD